MRLIPIAALLAAALASPAALAQTASTAGAPPPPRKTLDADKDGAIDRGEAAASPRLAAQFDSLDRNGDGKLDDSERPQRKHGGHGNPFAELDTDKDGRISKAEAAAKPGFAERFAQMDANKDGFFDRADREQAMKQRRDAWFTAADSNRDGSLSKAEFDAAHAKRAEGRKHGGWGRGPAPAKDAAAK